MTTTLILLSFLLPFAPIFLVRWSRWLAIVQQKEYRLDRLWSFLNSSEGQLDTWRVLPRLHEFTRTGLKRPVRTIRILIVAAVSMVLMGIVMMLVAFVGNWMALIGTVLVLYMLLPFILILSCVPTSVVSSLVTLKTLWQAKQKIDRHRPLIIGVGGSYGKTTTKHLLHHVLSQNMSVFVTPKSHNTKYSVAKSICDGYTNQKVALLEYGAYTRGEIAYLTRWFPPKYAIETGFTLQHLGLFGSVENSLIAESELIAALPSDGQAFCQLADPGAQRICELGAAVSMVNVVAYSGPKSVVKLDKPELNTAGQLSFLWKGKRVRTQLIGQHYLINVQGVIAVAEALEMTDKEIITPLENFTPNSSFIQSRSFKNDTVVIDDGGTSNPKGFAAAIELAKEMVQKHKVLVASGIVDLGDQTHEVHQELASAAKKVFDEVWYVGKDGQAEFERVFGPQCTTEEAQVLKHLADLPATSLIVLEGKMPKWFLEKVQ